jgi:hypothetical protein
MGVWTHQQCDEEGEGLQISFVDTPGYVCSPRYDLHRRMNSKALKWGGAGSSSKAPEVVPEGEELYDGEDNDADPGVDLVIIVDDVWRVSKGLKEEAESEANDDNFEAMVDGGGDEGTSFNSKARMNVNDLKELRIFEKFISKVAPLSSPEGTGSSSGINSSSSASARKSKVIVLINKCDTLLPPQVPQGNKYQSNNSTSASSSNTVLLDSLRYWRKTLPDSLAILPVSLNDGKGVKFFTDYVFSNGVKSLNQVLPVRSEEEESASEEVEELFPFGLFPEMFPSSPPPSATASSDVPLFPPGPWLYDPEYLTDKSERFIAQEMVRAEIFDLYGKEIPYEVDVRVEGFTELEEEEEDEEEKEEEGEDATEQEDANDDDDDDEEEEENENFEKDNRSLINEYLKKGVAIKKGASPTKYPLPTTTTNGITSRASNPQSNTKRKDVRFLSCKIVCSRESLKPIVIGAGGRKLKQLGIAAREKLEQFFGTKIMLNLRVTVDKNWRTSV